MGIDLFEIIAQQRFATSKKQVQTAGCGNLIDDRHPFFGTQFFAMAAPERWCLPTKITMHTPQITAIGQSNAAGNQDPARLQFAAERSGEVPIGEGLGFRTVHVYATSCIKSASNNAWMKSFKSMAA